MPRMKELGLLLIFMFAWSVGVSAQTEINDKITLKTGEVFVGKIQLKNTELILIESEDGARYQFPTSEIKSIEKVDLNKSNSNISHPEKGFHPENKVIFGLLEISGGVYSAKNKLSAAPGGQLSLTFGAKLFNQKSIFTGLGIGLSYVLNTKEDETINFLPIYLALKTKLNNKTNAPFLGLRAGYSFALSSEMNGGLYSRLSAGWSYQLHENTILLVGLHTDVQAFSGNLIETNQIGNYSYYGNSGLLSFGLSVGIEF